MPIYRYIAFNKKGKEEKGIIDASNLIAARKTLRVKGLYVKTMAEDSEKKERELFPFLTKLLYRVPRRDVGLFARQLGTLIDAGIPLDRSLANIIEQTENEYLKKALIQIRADVVEGESLSESLKKHGAIFPPMYYNLISIGEKTGAYEQTLVRLADLEDANQAMRNKITTAMFYPLIMMSLLGSILIFLLAVVFPQIEQLFVQMNAELPLVTRIVIGVSHIFTRWWSLLLFVGSVGGSIYFFKKWKSQPKGRETWERFILTKPVIGVLNRKVILARFSRNLGVMLQSRVPLISALQVIAKVVDHLVFEKEILVAIERIKEGTKMTDALRDSVIVNQMMLGMLSAGEASDRIPEMVGKIADVLEDDVDASIQKLSTMLEPAMMVVMGGMITLIMTAVMLPMYNLTKQMQL